MRRGRAQLGGLAASLAPLVGGCAAPGPHAPGVVIPGTPAPRLGDEIVIAGQSVHTGVPVVLWIDPGGYDAYRVERRFAPPGEETRDPDAGGPQTPNRYGTRRGLSHADAARVREAGWDVPMLARYVDQVVLHYDVCGTSRRCFEILHDRRGLSCHFLLDVDGTVYQTLDAKDRAWHATIANDRSIGIEIANIGAYPRGDTATLDSWYARDEGGWRVTFPFWVGATGIRTPGFVARPTGDGPVTGEIHGEGLVQYDLTAEQYDSLAGLLATLCVTLPGITPDAPRDHNGDVLTRVLDEHELELFSGILGHFHIQRNKVDPGPALRWDVLLEDVRSRMGRR